MATKGIAENFQEANEAGVNLLISDAEIALTLLDSANITSDPEGHARRVRQARKAYDSILHLLGHLSPDEVQRQALDGRVSLLRKRLIAAGVLPE